MVSPVTRDALRITLERLEVPPDNPDEARRRSTLLLGNEKAAEVVVALARRGAPSSAAQLSKDTRVPHGLVRAVLVRLEKANVLASTPALHARGQVFYGPTGDAWPALLALAEVVYGREAVHVEGGGAGL
jgi:hypothetical protein